MKIGKYTINLPISSDYPHQLLYRGNIENQQSLLINIFPKIELDQNMFDSIQKRISHYNYINEAIEDDTNIFLFYSDSSNWMKMPQKITNKQFCLYVKQLYKLFSSDTEGYYDFKFDHLYCNEENVFVLDYGLSFILKKQKLEQINQIIYAQNQLMKTWMFGSLIYCLSTGIKDCSSLIKLSQEEINFYIEYNCRANCISEENIDLIKLMLRVDFDTRPAFDQLQNHPLLRYTETFRKTILFSAKNQALSCIKLKKLEVESNEKQQEKKCIKSTTNLSSVHHQIVQSAFKRQRYLKSSKYSSQTKFSQYQFASQLIAQKLSKSKSNNTIQQIKTTESFYKPNQIENNTYQDKRSDSNQSKKTTNFKNLQLNMESIKQNTQESSEQKSNNVATKQVKIEKKPQLQQKPKGNQINSFDNNIFQINDEENDSF